MHGTAASLNRLRFCFQQANEIFDFSHVDVNMYDDVLSWARMVASFDWIIQLPTRGKARGFTVS